MEKYDVVIIGAGLGGLLCGNVLSREGYSVIVLDQNRRIGGSIQSFTRKGVVFNTGLNYTESLGEGEILNRYFKYFNILDKLKIKRMDTNSFERMSYAFDENEYPFAQGYNNFVESLSKYFPNEKQNLYRYVKDLQKVGDSFPLYNLDNTISEEASRPYLTVGAFDYLKSVTNDKKLQAILAGMNSLYGGEKHKTPLYVHALINNSFIKSSWRLPGGSSQLALAIAKTIEENGGKVLRKSKVVKLGGKDKQLEYAELDNGTRFYAKHIISNLHPAPTLNMVEPELSKKGHTSRINSLPNTIGMFTLYLRLKPETFPYLNYNHHYFNEYNSWTTKNAGKNWPGHYMLYTPPQTMDDKWAKGIIVITYMPYSEVAKWDNTFVEQRGNGYLEFKQKKAEQLIDLVSKKFPNIKSCIKEIYSSTPLTYRDYTGTPNGSAYGVSKDFRDPLSTIISPKSRVKNLYFTGQNLNMHGILGVTINSIITCGSIIEPDYLLNKIRQY